MRRRPGPPAGSPGAVEVLDEAIHLLRLAPAGALLSFYVGSVPFVLGFLFFWLDRGRITLARRHVAEDALLLALLYVWMKAWQAAFARALRGRLAGPPEPLQPSGWARHLLAQAALQPTSLFILPFAAFILLPYGWAYAFYQSLAVTGDPAAARRHAALWPRQNHAILLILLLLGYFVFLNVSAAMFIAPFLLKMLFGVETAFSRSPAALFNTTFFLVASSLTYLAVAPVAKAAYAVRCFHGDALTTGEDLRSDLRGVSKAPRRAAAILLLVLALDAGSGTPASSAAAMGPAAPSRQLPADAIDRAIRRVARRREFDWRRPEAPVPEEEKGILTRFFEDVADTTLNALRSFFGWIGDLLEKLARFAGHRARTAGRNGEGMAWLTSVQGLLAILLAIVACAAALFFWRSRRRSATLDLAIAQAVPAIPDVSVDDGSAAAVPAENWIDLARDLSRQGDFRQAVRALYLACLSLLAARGLLSLARFKSNRDYQGELRRRGRGGPDLGPLFADNVALFERVWYGRHEATVETVRVVTANLERLRTHAPE